MKSYITKKFRVCFSQLPERIKNTAKQNYLIWKKAPHHPGLKFKRITNKSDVWSVRIGLGYRAIGVKSNDAMVWFWIGSHEDYNKLLK